MYKSNAPKSGKIFIFNNVEFDDVDLATREGSDKDARDLRDVFGNHEFDVAGEKKNLKMIDFLKEIEKISKEDFKDYKCMIAIFLSHGEKDHIYMKDRRVELEQITECFRGDKCPSLNEKPKIIIFQACRGGKAEKPALAKTTKNQPVSGDIERDGDAFNESSEVEDAGTSCSIPAGADFVMCFASNEGYVSFRDKQNGSWYIQNLVFTLKKYFASGNKDDTFLDLMTKVSGQVSEFSLNGKMQMPSITSTLRDKYYFPK